MRTEQLIQRVLKPCQLGMHQVRFRCLRAVVVAVLRAGTLGIGQLGRAMRSSSAAKHQIKRVDRLLSNRHLYQQRMEVYGCIVQAVLPKVPQLVVLIDWTKCVDGMEALVASIPVCGRSVMVYAEVHPKQLLKNPKVQGAFVRRLQELLPESCHAGLVADAGFAGDFYQQVTDLCWHFVVRLRGTVRVRKVDAGLGFQPLSELFALAGSQPSYLGRYAMGLSRILCKGLI